MGSGEGAHRWDHPGVSWDHPGLWWVWIALGWLRHIEPRPQDLELDPCVDHHRQLSLNGGFLRGLRGFGCSNLGVRRRAVELSCELLDEPHRERSEPNRRGDDPTLAIFPKGF